MTSENRTSKEIIEGIKNSEYNKVKLAVTDIDGILRGKVVHKDKFLSIVEGGFGFCDVVFGWDANDLCYEDAGVEYTGWHTGYPDADAVIDPQTFRQIPWEEGTPFFLADFDNGICPRSILKRVKADCELSGYEAIFSQEYEWFNFSETSEELYSRDFRNPRPMTKGMFGYSVLRASQKSPFFNDLFELMEEFDVKLEGLHTETGPGVYEAAIMYDDILRSADKSVLFKTAAKEIGHLHGVMPTFMAKWNESLPGCSGHIHQSLWKDGKNVFFDENSKTKMSSLMESYLAGLLKYLPEVLCMYAPTINSFKRLVEGMWAPTTLTWAIDNRTTALRALPGSSKSTRIENRVVGSDMNPYLAMAASLASGLAGIKENLKLETPMTIGNGYQDFKNGTLPNNLWAAAENLENSQFAKDAFGEKFVKHFAATRKWEVKQFQKVVTDWELKRYFEVI